MSYLKRLAEIWWQTILFILWSLVIADLLQNKKYLHFLHPSFGIILLVGLITLLLFILSDILKITRKRFHTIEALRGLILLAPVFFILNAEKDLLDSYAFKKRMLEVVSQKEKMLKAADQKSDKGAAKNKKHIPQTDQKAEVVYNKVNISKLFQAAYYYKNKNIEITGMINNSAKVKEICGKNCVIVFRFVVSCCVADAVPVSVVVETKQKNNIKDDSWVTAKGKFIIRETKGRKYLALENATIKKTKKPDRPYLY